MSLFGGLFNRRTTAPIARERSTIQCARAVPTPRPCASGATDSILNSPSPSPASSRHGEPGGQ